MLIPRFDLIVYVTAGCVHQGAVILLNLTFAGGSILGRTRLMNLQKTTNLLEQLTFKMLPLIRKNVERVAKIIPGLQTELLLQPFVRGVAHNQPTS